MGLNPGCKCEAREAGLEGLKGVNNVVSNFWLTNIARIQ